MISMIMTAIKDFFNEPWVLAIILVVLSLLILNLLN